MISVYDIGNENFSGNGNATLIPTKGRLRAVAGGAYEITMEHPIDPDGKWEHLVPGAIIKVPVPVERIENAFIGIEVDVYRANRKCEIREGKSEPHSITYDEWSFMDTYSVGSKVTCTGWGNYQCIFYDGSSESIMVPPYNNPSWWKKIADSTSGSPVIMTIQIGYEVYLVNDEGGGWLKVSTPIGITGYIRSTYVDFVEHRTPTPADDRVIKDQLFRIIDVTINNNKNSVSVNANHVSNDLNAILLNEVSVVQVSPTIAISRIINAMAYSYRGDIATNLMDVEETYTGDLTGKNAMFALLDPDNGIVPKYNARFTRDNWDLFLMKRVYDYTGMKIAYGKNAKGITWKQDAGNLITRVVPVAKNSVGADLYLPEAWVDSEHIDDYPVIKMERLTVKGQIGKAKDEEGNKWTEADLLQEMRDKAQERFNIDHVDRIRAEVTVDFEQIGNLSGYEWLQPLQSLLLYDVIAAEDSRIGLNLPMIVTEIEYDYINRRLTGIKVSTEAPVDLRTVSGYNVLPNSITPDKLMNDTTPELESGISDAKKEASTVNSRVSSILNGSTSASHLKTSNLTVGGHATSYKAVTISGNTYYLLGYEL